MPQKPEPEELQDHVQSLVEEAKQEVGASRKPWYYISRAARVLLILYAIQLTLFASLAWWVHYHPIVPLDVTITREFQENTAPWLRISMMVISYPGNTPILALLVVLTAIIFWVVGLRLEAVFTLALSAISEALNFLLKVLIGFTLALSAISEALNFLLKVLIARPRPSAHSVDVFQTAAGHSFPSGHVMAYLAFWGLLFSFGIILFTGARWWRILLLVVSALFVVLIGPSRIYLGNHWASDVLGSYLIGGVLLGIALWIYLKLKERGILETKRARKRTEKSKLFRSFLMR